MYSPFLGRFISPDSVVPGAADPQNFNRYSYTRNNPLRYTDPSGHCTVPVTLFGLDLGTITIGSASCPWDKKEKEPVVDNPLNVNELPPVIDNPQGSNLPDLPIFDGDPSGTDDLDLPVFDIPPVPKPSTGSDIGSVQSGVSKPGRYDAKSNPGDRKLDELCSKYGCTKEERRRIGRAIEDEKKGAPRGPDGKASDLTAEEMEDFIKEEINKRPPKPDKAGHN